MDKETWIEVGLALFAAMVLGGLGILAGGRAAGDVQRGRRRRAGPPAPGAVPAERQQARGVISPR